ncbi:unnamed protein product, partial [Symbiodinium pilosum]
MPFQQGKLDGHFVERAKKLGWLYLDGVRFILETGVPIQVAEALTVGRKKEKKSKILTEDFDNSGAVALKQGSIVCLEGALRWTAENPPHPRRALGFLPQGHWPERREVFFTRGHMFAEVERCRVDIDCHGRIFCPEGGAEHGHVNLSGIIFKASANDTPHPAESNDWDDLAVQYSSVKDVAPRGTRKVNEHNLDDIMGALWNRKMKRVLDEMGVKSPHLLFQLSLPKLQKVLKELASHDAALQAREETELEKRHMGLAEVWETSKHGNLHVKHLKDAADEIVEQMVARWDFDAQMQGLLNNDFRAPLSIRHLYPPRHGKELMTILKDFSNDETAKFNETYQFFRNFETNGNTMTHCSLMGTKDHFTDTGKWHFPDSPNVQTQLFENIAWLYGKGIFHYISERQTPRFPFIEDFDIQAETDYTAKDPRTGLPPPPDSLIMDFPSSHNHDPGQLMKWRALAIHCLFPHLMSLRCLVYSASGYNKGKELMKSSFHLVWPDLIVDPDTAAKLREVTLQMFTEQSKKTGTYLHDLLKKLFALHETNDWLNVFDKTTISATNGLRLPYNDKVSQVYRDPEDKERVKRGEIAKNKAPKVRVKENRYSKAIGEILFIFDKDDAGKSKISSAKWQNTSDRSIAKWIQMGSCRLDMTDAERTQPTKVCPSAEGRRLLRNLKRQYDNDGRDFGLDIGSDDEEFATHTPFPNIRRCKLSPQEFAQQFDEHLYGELENLESEISTYNKDLARKLKGAWISITDTQAIWRGPGGDAHCAKSYGWMPRWKLYSHPSAPMRASRPLELVYLAAADVGDEGKIIVDGPKDAKRLVLDILRYCQTDFDDVPMVSRYDLTKVSEGPSADELKAQLEEVKQRSETQRQEMEQQQEESTRLTKDLQAQLEALSQSAKDKQQAEEEVSRINALLQSEKAQREEILINKQKADDVIEQMRKEASDINKTSSEERSKLLEEKANLEDKMKKDLEDLRAELQREKDSAREAKE